MYFFSQNRFGKKMNEKEMCKLQRNTVSEWIRSICWSQIINARIYYLWPIYAVHWNPTQLFEKQKIMMKWQLYIQHLETSWKQMISLRENVMVMHIYYSSYFLLQLHARASCQFWYMHVKFTWIYVYCSKVIAFSWMGTVRTKANTLS